MKKKRILSWVLSLVMALTVFSIPVGGVFAEEEENEGPTYALALVDEEDNEIFLNDGENCVYDANWPEYEIMPYRYMDGEWESIYAWGDVDSWVVSNPDFAEIRQTYEENAIFLAPKEEGDVTLTARVYDYDFDDEETEAEISINISITSDVVNETKWNHYFDPYGDSDPYKPTQCRATYESYGGNVDQWMTIYIPSYEDYIEDNESWNEDGIDYYPNGYPIVNEEEFENFTIEISNETTGQDILSLTGKQLRDLYDYWFDEELSRTKATGGNLLKATFKSEGDTIRTEEFLVQKYVDPTLSYTRKYTYDGKYHKPKVTVKVGSTVLTAGTDYYPLDFSSRKSVGEGSFDVISMPMSKYYFDASGTFKVYPKGTSIKKLKKAKKAITVSWSKQATKMATSRITGYQVQVATNKAFTKNKKTVTVSGYTKTSKKITKLKKKKKYFVRVRTYKTVDGDRYYSSWSKVKTVKTK